MTRAKTSSARLALIARKLAQEPSTKAVVTPLREEQGNPSSVFGGHRTGKRKRGVSVTKRKPRATVSVTRFDLIDRDGNTVAYGAKTIEYRREPNA